MSTLPEANELAAEWQDFRVLYPLYSALAREFVIELSPCSDLESGVESVTQESVEQARQWFVDMDQHIQVHQLRQFLQTTTLTSEDGLRVMLQHYLNKLQRNSSDRDKIDFLLVQFFSHCAPSRLEDDDVEIGYVAQVLEPIFSTGDFSAPDWLAPLDEYLRAANDCHSLNDLLTAGILEKGRKLKASSGEKYFVPGAMVAFTRFSFLMRRVFFRLMHQDLNSILDGLRELEVRGVSTLDCRRAQCSVDEPIARLRMICQSWKVKFHADYSSGQPLRMLVDLRAVIKAALARTPSSAGGRPAGPRTKAAAAGTNSSASDSEAPEFVVSSDSLDRKDDGSA
jgi:hypothetical protein